MCCSMCQTCLCVTPYARRLCVCAAPHVRRVCVSLHISDVCLPQYESLISSFLHQASICVFSLLCQTCMCVCSFVNMCMCTSSCQSVGGACNTASSVSRVGIVVYNNCINRNMTFDYTFPSIFLLASATLTLFY